MCDHNLWLKFSLDLFYILYKTCFFNCIFVFVCHQLFHHTSANLNYEFNKKWDINMYFFSPFNCMLANWFCKNSYCKLFYIMAIIMCDDIASKAKTLELGRVTINLFLHHCRHFCCLRMGNIFLWAHTVFWQKSIIFVYFGFKLYLLHKSKMCKKALSRIMLSTQQEFKALT